eukprot:jgi/Ulvmu1/3292/UM153_0004.1
MTFFARPKAREQARRSSGPGAQEASKDIGIQPVSSRCPVHIVDGLDHGNTAPPIHPPNNTRQSTKVKTRTRPAKPPPQDPAVTMQIITDQAAFATEIMRRERALAGKQAFTDPNSNSTPAVQQPPTDRNISRPAHDQPIHGLRSSYTQTSAAGQDRSRSTAEELSHPPNRGSNPPRPHPGQPSSQPAMLASPGHPQAAPQLYSNIPASFSAPGHAHLPQHPHAAGMYAGPPLVTSLSCPEPESTTTNPWMNHPPLYTGPGCYDAGNAWQHPAHSPALPPRALPGYPPPHAPAMVPPPQAPTAHAMPHPGAAAWGGDTGSHAAASAWHGSHARTSFQGPPLYSIAPPSPMIASAHPQQLASPQPAPRPPAVHSGGAGQHSSRDGPVHSAREPAAARAVHAARASGAVEPSGAAQGSGQGWWPADARQEPRRDGGFMGRLAELKPGPSDEQRAKAERAKLELKQALEQQIADKKQRDAEAKALARQAELQEENKAKAYLQALGADASRGAGEGRRRFRAIGNPVAVSPPASPSVSPGTSPPPQPRRQENHDAARATDGSLGGRGPRGGVAVAAGGPQHPSPDAPGPMGQVWPHAQGSGVGGASWGMPAAQGTAASAAAAANAAAEMRTQGLRGPRGVRPGAGDAVPAHESLPRFMEGGARVSHEANGPGRQMAAGGHAWVVHGRGCDGAGASAADGVPPGRQSPEGREGSAGQRQALVELLRDVQAEQRRMREHFEQATQRMGAAAQSTAASPERSHAAAVAPSGTAAFEAAAAAPALRATGEHHHPAQGVADEAAVTSAAACVPACARRHDSQERPAGSGSGGRGKGRGAARAGEYEESRGLGRRGSRGDADATPAARRAGGKGKWRAPQGPCKRGAWAPPPPLKREDAVPVGKPVRGGPGKLDVSTSRARAARAAPAVSASVDSAQLDLQAAVLRQGAVASRVARAASASDKLRRIRSARVEERSARHGDGGLNLMPDQRCAGAPGEAVGGKRDNAGTQGGEGAGDALSGWAAEELHRAAARRKDAQGSTSQQAGPSVSASCATIPATSQYLNMRAERAVPEAAPGGSPRRRAEAAGAVSELTAASFLLPPSVNFVPERPERVRLSAAALDALRVTRQHAAPSAVPPAAISGGVQQAPPPNVPASHQEVPAGEDTAAACSREMKEGCHAAAAAAADVRVGGASLATLRRDEEDLVRLGTGQTPSCSPDLVVDVAPAAAVCGHVCGVIAKPEQPSTAESGDKRGVAGTGASGATHVQGGNGPAVDAGVDSASVCIGEEDQRVPDGAGRDEARPRLTVPSQAPGGGVEQRSHAVAGRAAASGRGGSACGTGAPGGGCSVRQEGAEEGIDGGGGCMTGVACGVDVARVAVMGGAPVLREVAGEPSSIPVRHAGLDSDMHAMRQLEGLIADDAGGEDAGVAEGGAGEWEVEDAVADVAVAVVKTPQSARRRWGAAEVLDRVIEHGQEGSGAEVRADAGGGDMRGVPAARYDEEFSPDA